MIVTIHQPEFLPWLGFFDRIRKCDLFVILDHVQFQKNQFINRNKIKTATGWQWITVPISNKFHHLPINKAEIDKQNKNWQRKIYRSLITNYSKAPYFKNYANFFKGVFENDWKLIGRLDIFLIESLMGMLGINTPVKKSSLLNVKGKGTELVINICKKVGADTYISGEGGRRYMNLKRFKEEKIKVIFQNFRHPTYRQHFSKTGFIPNMSIIDLLFNCGGK